MKLQKIILCIAIALTAFGASVGLLEIGGYLRGVFQPVRVEIKQVRPVAAPTIVYQLPVVEYKQPEGLADSDQPAEDEYCKFRATGDYTILGQNPKGFEDFDYLSVITSEYDEKSDKNIAVKPKGLIKTKIEFKFTWINIANKKISLVTRAKKGVSYQFDGKFVDEEATLKDENGNDYTEQVFLKGRLTKWLNGKKIAESKVKFSVMCGC